MGFSTAGRGGGGRRGRGWQGCRSSSRINARTSSGLQPSPLPDQLGVDPAVAVGAVGQLEDRRDVQLQVLPSLDGGRGRPVLPFVVAGPRHLRPTGTFHGR